MKAPFACSEYTPLKQEAFAAILSMWFKLAGKTAVRNPYFHHSCHYIDLTAGPGVHEGKAGSPKLFLDMARDHWTGKLLIDLVDLDPWCYNRLKILWDQEPAVRIHNADCADAVQRILGNPYPWGLAKNQLGLVYMDPSGEVPDFSTLATCAIQRPRMEILIHLSATTIKRVKVYQELCLNDYLSMIPKRYWLVREPVDQHQWTFLMGSNTNNFKSWKGIGLWRIDSERGRKVFERLNTTGYSENGQLSFL